MTWQAASPKAGEERGRREEGVLARVKFETGKGLFFFWIGFLVITCFIVEGVHLAKAEGYNYGGGRSSIARYIMFRRDRSRE